jgi:hypothetical protein
LAAQTSPTEIIYASQLHIAINQVVNNLELIVHASNPGQWVFGVEYLPSIITNQQSTIANQESALKTWPLVAAVAR